MKHFILALLLFLILVIAVQAEPTTETLDASNNVGSFSSIDFTSGGNAVVSYYNSTSANLRIAICNNAACSAPIISFLDSGTDDAGKYTSVALDSSNFPIVAYAVADTTEEYIRVAACGDTACTTVTRYDADTGINSDNDNRLGTSVSMALNGNVPIIAYTSRDNTVSPINRPKIAFCGDRECMTSVVTTLPIDPPYDNGGRSTQLGLTSANIPIVVFEGFTTGSSTKLVVAVCDNNTDCANPNLVVGDVGDDAIFSGYGDIAVVMNGDTAVIGFIESSSTAGGHALRYITCTGTTCTSAVTVAANIRDCCMDMTLDSSGNPVFVYNDLTWNSFIAVCDTVAACANPIIEAIDAIGFYPAIALNTSDFPYIAYQSNTDAALRICDSTTCQLLPVYASGPLANSTLTALTDGVSAIAPVQLAITNVGDTNSLLDVTLLNPLIDFTITNLDIVGQTPAAGATQLDITCTTPLATETLTLQTNEVPPQTYTYTLFCASSSSVTIPGDTITEFETVGIGDTDYIIKTVDNPLAPSGSVVTYTISAHNPKDIPLTQVVIFDVFDELLLNPRLVSTTHGFGEIRGDTLFVSGFTLQPDETASIIVEATISTALQTGEVIPNIAGLSSPDASVHVSNPIFIGNFSMLGNGGAAEILIIPSQLPSTGQPPAWRNAILAFAGLMLVLISLVFGIRRVKN